MTAARKSTIESVRRDFDAAFAEPIDAQIRAEQGALLVLRAGGQKFALRSRDVAGILCGKTVVPVRGADAVLGVAGVRGELVSVFGLTELLRASRESAPANRTWLALLRGDRRVALSFDEFDGYRDIADSGTSIQAAGSSAPPFVTLVAQRPGGSPRWIIDAGLVLAHVRSCGAPHQAQGENDEA